MDDIHRALLGNLSLKSSVLSTKGENITKQFMVANNMLSHYKKLQNVKPAVDTRPPKAMLYSTKARDQRLRNLAKADSTAVLAIKSLLAVKHPNLGYLSPSVDSQKLDGRSGLRQRPAEAEPMDVLDLHPHKFTPGKPFWPRTNRSDCSSKLSQLRVYNPPPPRARSAARARTPAASRQSTTSNTSRTASSNTARSQMSLDPPRTPQGAKPPASNGRRRSRQRLSLTKSTMDDMTLRSPPPTSSSFSRNLDVPPLDISVDQDNQLWQRVLSDKRSGLNLSAAFDVPNAEVETKENLNVSNSSKLFKTSTLDTMDLKSLEEDCKYIQFLQEVTEDILQKGSYTNKILSKIFEYHIDKHAHELKESRMREMLNQLRIDLGIPHRAQELDSASSLLQYSTISSQKGPRTKRKTENEEGGPNRRLQTDFSSSIFNSNNNALNDSFHMTEEGSSSVTGHSKESESQKKRPASGSGKKGALSQSPPLALPSPGRATITNMENVKEWLSNNVDNKSTKSRMGSGGEEEEKPAASDRSEAKSAQSHRGDHNGNDDDDEGDGTVTSLSSVDYNYDEDTRDILNYYNSTVRTEDDRAQGPWVENGFNRTSLSDIPEMSYRSEMVKQRSVEEGSNIDCDKSRDHTLEKRKTTSEESPPSGTDNGLEVSAPDVGLSSSVSSRSRRRVKVAEMAASARSEAAETSGEMDAAKKEEAGDSSNDSLIVTQVGHSQSPADRCANPVSEDQDQKSKKHTEITRERDDEDAYDTYREGAVLDNPASIEVARGETAVPELPESDYDYDDDIEEECSIPVGGSSDDDNNDDDVSDSNAQAGRKAKVIY